MLCANTQRDASKKIKNNKKMMNFSSNETDNWGQTSISLNLILNNEFVLVTLKHLCYVPQI